MKLQPHLRDSVSTDGAFSPLRRVRPLRATRHVWLRRLAFAGPVLAAPLLGTWLAASLTAGVGGVLRLPLLALLSVNLLYLALTGWPGVLGALVRLFGRGIEVSAQPGSRSRTALVMPVYNENPQAVFAAVETMARAVDEAGLQRVDLFVLSDTRDPALAAVEEAAFASLRARLPADGPGLHYRRRVENTRRKVGNLAEFCERWGARYDYMVVLDADSLMGASTIRTLIGLMDANPRAGMIQTVPYPVGRETLFARIQQFAARLYTAPLVEGLLFWQQSDGNYWGHNAIVRIAPFVAHCDLPVLPGAEPFGGEILCHDVVEAGLMRAAGWDVWVLPQVVESYEGLPANLVDFAARERRWCQGNLQHLNVLARARLRPLGRFHLAYGVMHYLAGPAAAAFLGLATLDAALGGHFASALFLGTGPAHAGLLALTLFLLYGAKVLALALAVADPAQARGYGGRARLLAGAALEQLAAFVAAPILVLFYTRYVWALLRGGSVQWEAQPRDDRGLSWREGWVRLRGHTLTGAAWLGVLLSLPGGLPGLLLWALPMLAGLLVSVPAAVLSSRTALGLAARRWGLFLTPEEAAPPPVLRAHARLLRPVEGARLRPPQHAALSLGPTAVEAVEGD